MPETVTLSELKAWNKASSSEEAERDKMELTQACSVLKVFHGFLLLNVSARSGCKKAPKCPDPCGATGQSLHNSKMQEKYFVTVGHVNAHF